MKACHSRKEKYTNEFFEYSLKRKKGIKERTKKNRKDGRVKIRKKGGGEALYALKQLKEK